MLVKNVLMLVQSFDCEDGLPEMAYDATQDLISKVMGNEATLTFRKYIKCQDDLWYLPEGKGKSVAHDMLKVMNKSLIATMTGIV